MALTRLATQADGAMTRADEVLPHQQGLIDDFAGAALRVTFKALRHVSLDRA
jgi:hypothetical protein